jgi:hypothetical protein
MDITSGLVSRGRLRRLLIWQNMCLLKVLNTHPVEGTNKVIRLSDANKVHRDSKWEVDSFKL